VHGLLERHPRLQLVIAHLGMPEYREFLELAERFEGVRLDTTMFATDFTERGANAFDRAELPRLSDLRSKILLGSDFPSIPYPYAHQLQALHRLGLGEEWLRAVLWENGARLFGIDAG
jgi:predicted TIM-barrel fold metal-dependent hydrolase